MMPIHIASLRSNRQKSYFFLMKRGKVFQWIEMDSCLNENKDTEIEAETISHALSKASKMWKEESFCFLHCGFRYTLPERDEVGCKALFWQMAESYNSPNGQYFDVGVGHLCYVDFASHEALNMWRMIRGKTRPL